MKVRLLFVIGIVASLLIHAGCGGDKRDPGGRSQLGVWVPMRDEVRLLTDVYLPEGQKPFPVIISRVPYGT